MKLFTVDVYLLKNSGSVNYGIKVLIIIKKIKIVSTRLWTIVDETRIFVMYNNLEYFYVCNFIGLPSKVILKLLNRIICSKILHGCKTY